LKLDVVAVAELGHQIGAPLDNAKPTGDVVENLVDDIVGDDVEEVLAINEVTYGPDRSKGRRSRRQRISGSAS
jgi:hypothetical protein